MTKEFDVVIIMIQCVQGLNNNANPAGTLPDIELL